MRGSHGTFYWNELMTRDVEGAKSILTDHINGCVAHALSIGALK